MFDRCLRRKAPISANHSITQKRFDFCKSFYGINFINVNSIGQIQHPFRIGQVAPTLLDGGIALFGFSFFFFIKAIFVEQVFNRSSGYILFMFRIHSVPNSLLQRL